MAPAPMGDLVRLSSRSSPVYFPGVLPMDVRLEVEARDGFTVRTTASSGRVESQFGDAEVRVERSDEKIVVRKSASARPCSVSPADYPALVRFVSDLQPSYAAPVEVDRAEDD